jgi:predicted solute-binding protein
VEQAKSLRLGCVRYLNARPLIRGWPGHVVFDHPAAISSQLQRGDLDAALVSSFEFLRNPVYRIVNGVAIAADGPVYSVIVAHRDKISDLQEIALDPASLTSVALLRVLLNELNLHPCLVSASAEDAECERAMLLIGDQAIRFRQSHANDFEFWDLAEAWKEMTGLPFVFALWLVRSGVSDIEKVAGQLRKQRDINLGDIDRLVTEEAEFDREFCRRYFLDHLRFSFGDREKEGLRVFAELCAKQGLIPRHDLTLNLV